MKAIAEAPSKVIITGEHFVVHGAWALAAAIPRKSRVEVSKSDRLRVSSDRFRGANHPALRAIARVVVAMSKEFSFSPSLTVAVSSQVPEGSGLGSSASTMVALSSSLSRLHSLRLSLDEVIRFSMIGEGQIHGRPSGIDSTVCARGGVILFTPGTSPKQVRLSRPRSLVVCHSGITRSTRRQINRVSGVKEMFPSLFAGLTESASEVSLMAADLLKKDDMKGLGRLLNFNHAVLSTLGVSNRALDRLVDLLLSLGCYGAKLTGAGGGGSVLAVAPEGKEKSIISGLKARGFDAFIAGIPVKGVESWLER
ncbi:MAG: mevalonate kinase [Thaumarchaeota archaeon]|nr:mevalonate kinase [Nitrososphaerota archaeon]